MVKRYGAIVGVLISSLGSGGAFAEERRRAFGPGEQTLYRVQYLGVTAGSAHITVGAPTRQGGQRVWPIVALAQSDPDLGIWPIKDKFVTYWDMENNRVVGSDLYADENRKRRRQRIRLSPDRKSAHVVKQKEGQRPVESTHEIAEDSFDAAGATFALRNLDLAVGKEYQLPVFTGTKSFVMRAKVEGIQMLPTSLGEEEVFRLRVQTGFDGKFQSKRDILAYLTTDPAHVPVRIEAEFVLGSIVAELTEYKQGRTMAASAALNSDG